MNNNRRISVELPRFDAATLALMCLLWSTRHDGPCEFGFARPSGAAKRRMPLYYAAAIALLLRRRRLLLVVGVCS